MVDTLGGGDNRKQKIYATCCIESNLFTSKSVDNGLVEITDKCRKKEHSVLCHEGFGQSVPPETIVHIIEDTFLSSTKVIELDNFSCGRFIVVSQDTTVCVFSFQRSAHRPSVSVFESHKSGMLYPSTSQQE